MSKAKLFKAKIEDAGNGMDAAYIEIPFDVKKEFGSGRPKVHALFDNKVEYRGMLARMGTPFHMLILRKDIRAQLGKGVGDEINVKLSVDDKPRVVEIPDNLRKHFGRNKKAASFFDSLSYTNKKEYVQYLTQAKREETRQRRFEKVIDLLKKEVKTPK